MAVGLGLRFCSCEFRSLQQVLTLGFGQARYRFSFVAGV